MPWFESSSGCVVGSLAAVGFFLKISECKDTVVLPLFVFNALKRLYQFLFHFILSHATAES